MSTPTQPEIILRSLPRWRRAALASVVPVFALLWVGGVASHWLGRENANQGLLASLFLLLAGLIVLLGAGSPRDTAALFGVALAGFVVEAIGVRFGVPFGHYNYTGVLQPQLLGVPVVMGLAWMALVAFACDFASRLNLSPWLTTMVAALWTTATDLVIDPLAANKFGYWTWDQEGIYYGIPFTNFVGWFVTGLLACRIIRLRQQSNFWAGFIGMAILLFFSLIALANSLLPVALIGFGLCVARISVRGRHLNRQPLNSHLN
ncbi:MAG: carotenoid biosynthesis protein [Acidobacteria bacterium]|nr:carotenoid biosynthesis protein [Acidobacteriota bacterium]